MDDALDDILVFDRCFVLMVFTLRKVVEKEEDFFRGELAVARHCTASRTRKHRRAITHRRPIVVCCCLLFQVLIILVIGVHTSHSPFKKHTQGNR